MGPKPSTRAAGWPRCPCGERLACTALCEDAPQCFRSQARHYSRPITGASAAASAAAPASFELEPERQVLSRLLGARASQFELGRIDSRDGHERFRLSACPRPYQSRRQHAERVLFGVNWYLKYIAHVQISTNGIRLGPARTWPLPAAIIEKETPYAYRYALNQNVDGYTAPYWRWARWEHEIDVLALSGINAMIVERGMDTVLYRTFRDVGYSDEEIRRWITQPAHQNWQLMGNLCCFNGPISSALLRQARRIGAANRRAPARARHHAGAARLLRHRAGRFSAEISAGPCDTAGRVGRLHPARLARSARSDVREARGRLLPPPARAVRR
jgi:hypothetical protein